MYLLARRFTVPYFPKEKEKKASTEARAPSTSNPSNKVTHGIIRAPGLGWLGIIGI